MLYIVFRAILNVTTEKMSRDLAWCKRIVMDIAFDQRSRTILSDWQRTFGKCATQFYPGRTKDELTEAK